jgi:hypothetical protein
MTECTCSRSEGTRDSPTQNRDERPCSTHVRGSLGQTVWANTTQSSRAVVPIGCSGGAEDEVVARVAEHDARHLARRGRFRAVLEPAASRVRGERASASPGGLRRVGAIGAVGGAGGWRAHCFCISPGPNIPRSPPFWNEPQSERSVAYLANTASVQPSARILSSYCFSSAWAASAVTSAVDAPVRRDTGLREPENLISRWRAPIWDMVAADACAACR